VLLNGAMRIARTISTVRGADGEAILMNVELFDNRFPDLIR
jgi:hypothetical protein